MTLEFQGKVTECFTYFPQPSYLEDALKPYHWYKHIVVLGAKYLQFPDAYVHSIERVESIEDPDEASRKEHELLIEEILDYPH